MAVSTKRILLVVLCASVLASPVRADDFDRPGWFVGVGGGLGADFLSDFIEDRTMGVVDIESTGSFNARGGYRWFSWLALEAMYEGVYGLKTRVLGVEVARFSTHALLANVKLILPIWRLQPYLGLGVGAQQATFDGLGVLEPFDTDRWDLLLRVGLGLDAYVTKNWLLNVEIAPSVRFADYGDPLGTSTDNVSLTFTGGVQYRF